MAKVKATDQLVAIKALDKDHILKQNKAKHVYRERDILTNLAAQPNVVKLEQTFQDKLNLYFAFEYCEHGSLNNLINKAGKLSEKLVKVYAAEIVSALEFIHKNNVMHRDLKPENIMIKNDFHLKIIDFGDSNYIQADQEAKEEDAKTISSLN